MFTKNRNLLYILASLLLLSCQNNINNNENIVVETTKTNTSIIDSLSNNIRSNPTNPELFVKRSEAYFSTNKLDEAINDLVIALKLDSLNTSYYNKIADYYLLQGKSEKVKEVLEKCLTIYPNHEDALLKLSKIYLYVEDYKKSNQYLTQVFKSNPNNAEAFFVRALIAKEMKDTARAIKNLQISVEKAPNYYDAYILLGLLYANLKNPIAIDYYQNAIDIIPNSYEAHYNLGMYYQENEKTEKAIEQYDYITQNVDSLNPMPYYNIGYIKLIYNEDFTSALQLFQKVITLKPNYIEAHHNLALCYENLGEFEKARKGYDFVLQHVPDYILSINGLNRLDKKQLKN